MKIGQLYIKSQDFDMNHNLSEAFNKGSLWNNLYSFYKCEGTQNTEMCEEEKILHLIRIYNFASLELRLYLCTHVDCEKTILELERINKELEKLRYYYESKYRALSGTTTINPKSFINNPWPWEVKN